MSTLVDIVSTALVIAIVTGTSLLLSRHQLQRQETDGQMSY
jgi:hypothetical protein